MPGRLHPDVEVAVIAGGYFPEMVDVSASDEEYWRLLSRLWSDGKTFCVVEQDIVVRPFTLGTLEGCPEAWAAASYSYMGGTYAGLGCARFHADLMALFPEAMERAGEIEYPAHTRGHWCTLDGILQRVLQSRGYRVCVHGTVEHLGDDYPAHGCIARPEVTWRESASSLSTSTLPATFVAP